MQNDMTNATSGACTTATTTTPTMAAPTMTRKMSRVLPVHPSSPSPSSTSTTTKIKEYAATSSSTHNDTNDNANVDQVVAKSKRAATFLWMLLHAQSCPYDGETNVCLHKGCKGTKRLLNHIKTCPAKNNPNLACPTKFQGCQDARKLLSHYRQCREKSKLQRKHQQSRLLMMNHLMNSNINSNLNNISTSSSSSKTTKQVQVSKLVSNKQQVKVKQQQKQQQTNFCLICTLLARHDKDVTEQMKLNRQQLHQQYNKSTSLPSTPTFHNHRSPSPATKHNKTVQFDFSPVPPAPRPRTESVGSISSLLRSTTRNYNRSAIRPRAESLDEKRSTFLSSSTSAYDPTLELELTNSAAALMTLSRNNFGGHSSSLASESTCTGTSSSDMNPSGNTTETLPFRKRSVSCSAVFNKSSPTRSFCETIMEE